jgi:hypothetical protein
LLEGVAAPEGVSAMLTNAEIGYSQPAVIREVSPGALILYGMTPPKVGTILQLTLYLLTVRLPAGMLEPGQLPTLQIQVLAELGDHLMQVEYCSLDPKQREIAQALYRVVGSAA